MKIFINESKSFALSWFNCSSENIRMQIMFSIEYGTRVHKLFGEFHHSPVSNYTNIISFKMPSNSRREKVQK